MESVRLSGEVAHSEVDFQYEGKTQNQENTIGKFWGEEKISYKGHIVYQFAYGGGWIK